ncbi:UNVERIFIED_CONTAM: hypothetical protein NCL1_37762 [Trichonephila clavipes]
MFFGFHHKIG